MDIQSILERAAERLAEDESLRSNLDDQQASAALKHALRWLETRLSQAQAAGAAVEPEQEIARAIGALRAVNAQFASSQAARVQAALDQVLPMTGLAVQVKNIEAAYKTPLIQRVVSRLRSIWRRSTNREPN